MMPVLDVSHLKRRAPVDKEKVGVLVLLLFWFINFTQIGCFGGVWNSRVLVALVVGSVFGRNRSLMVSVVSPGALRMAVRFFEFHE